MLAGDVEPDVSVYGNRGQFSSEALPKQKPIFMFYRGHLAPRRACTQWGFWYNEFGDRYIPSFTGKRHL